MSFFKNDDTEENKDDSTEESEMITVGDKEYSQDDLQSLVGLGEIGREAEDKFNTKLDKVWPEYSKKSNQLKEVQAELDELKSEKDKPVPTPGEEDQLKSMQDARDAATKLGIITEDNFSEMLNKNFRTKYNEERAAEKLLESTSGLEKEIDGTDGRPKFDQKEILEYMSETGHRSPLEAYESKYKTENDEWRVNKIIEAKNGSPGLKTTEVTASTKQPSKVSITTDNLEQAMREALNE